MAQVAIPGPVWSRQSILGCVAVVMFAWVFQSLTFIGFEGYNDDSRYVEAAVGWITDFPFVGESHWAIRHPFVLALAASLSLFGDNEAAGGIPSLLSYLGIVGVTYWAVLRTLGITAAVFCAAFVSLVPIAAVSADSVVLWPTELLLILVSFFLLWSSGRGNGSIRLAMLAGVFAGFAFVTRETTAGYLLGLGVLFLLGIGPPRKFYVWMALGWLAAIAVDTIYFGMSTGDWAYRLRVSTNHGLITRASMLGAPLDIAKLEILLDPTSAAKSSFQHLPLPLQGKGHPYLEYALLDVGRFWSPYAMLFVHYYFGFTFWIGLIGALFVRPMGQALAVSARHYAFPLALLILGISWFVCAQHVLGLRPHPRYWGLSVYAAAVLGGLWAAWLWTRGRRALVAIGIAGLIAAHALLVQMNDSGQAYARELVDFVEQEQRVVHIRVDTWQKDKVYFKMLRGVGDLVMPLPDESAQLILVIENEETPAPILAEPDQWCSIWAHRSRTTWMGQLLDWTGILGYLPDKYARPLMVPEGNIAIYERGACPP